MVSLTAEQHISVPLLRASWDNLTFVHWRVAPERVQALLPSGLEVDVHDGSAWVSLTPFVMGNMRPLGVPDLPGGLRVPGSRRLPRLADVSSTPETNLRTYVRGPDGRDGLWFLTIDTGSAALAAAIRAAVGAPYHRARMSVEHDERTVTYAGSEKTLARGVPAADRTRRDDHALGPRHLGHQSLARLHPPPRPSLGHAGRARAVATAPCDLAVTGAEPHRLRRPARAGRARARRTTPTECGRCGWGGRPVG